MRILYTGNSQIREVGQCRWTTRTLSGRVQEVHDPETVAAVVGHTGFEIAEDEPLLQVGATLEQVQLMAMSGIAAVDILANAPAAKVKELADLLGVSESEIKKWAKAAKALPGDSPVYELQPEPNTDNKPEPTKEETTA